MLAKPTALILILPSPRTLQECDRCGKRQSCRPTAPIPGPTPAMYLDPINVEVVCAHCVWGDPEAN